MSGYILMYHRVAALRTDPYGLAVHPHRFVGHLEKLQRLCCVVPLAEVVVPGRAPRVAITFDDGYADNATTAAPLLAAAELPVTWFVTTGCPGGRRFWWDRLAAALLSAHSTVGGADLDVGGRRLWLDLSGTEARRTALRFLHRRLRPLPPDELETTMADLLNRLAVSIPEAVPGDDQTTMNVTQLRAVADMPLAEVGAHTRTHLQLRGQRAQVQRDEIVGSVGDLTALLDRPVTSFAYPFGSPSSVGSLAPRLVREAGCRLACTTDGDMVTNGHDRYRLPRFAVGDWDVDKFSARIDQLLAGR